MRGVVTQVLSELDGLASSEDVFVLAVIGDFVRALREVRPSSGPWFELARNIVKNCRPDGAYAGLRDAMKRTRQL